MLKAVDLAEREAKHGEKMIEIRLRFWTNDISEENGKVIPQHAWTSGMARMAANKAHGIESGSAVGFESLLEVGSAIETLLIAHGIKLHRSPPMKKYLID